MTTFRIPVTDELELRSTVAAADSPGGQVTRRGAVHDHGGPGAGGKQLQSGQDAHSVRGRAVRRVQDDGRDGAGRGEAAAGLDLGNVFVHR